MGRNVTKFFRRMRDCVVAIAIFALALLIIAKLENQQAQRFHGSFLAIDGDTLLSGGERLRLEGLDAPEIDQTCTRPDGRPYACGADARQALADLVGAGAWECSGTDRDRYRRLLVVCRRGSDDLGQLMVASGAALAEGRYLAEEGLARREGRGIWDGRFERPSEWRRIRKFEEAEQMASVRTFVPHWILTWFEE